ncbi:MAG: thioredoxin family protein [Bacteroidota bacterium]
MTTSITTALDNSISYEGYLALLQDLVNQGQTTGPNQSPAMVNYTKLNAARMRRVDKKVDISTLDTSAIKAINQPLTWLVITESWCGDAAHIVPVVNKLASLNPLITTKHIMRDEHPEVMDQFLTNEARSIPIIAFIDEERGEIVGHWGPRPAELQQKVMDRKKMTDPGPYDLFQVEVQKWYNQDKGQSTIQEFLAAFTEATMIKVINP